MKAADFSFVSAVLNKSPSLWDYFQSIAGQKYEGTIEVIIVDDGSIDGTAEIVGAIARRLNSERLTIRLIKNDRNTGNCASRNKGVTGATGRVIAVMDADCCVNETFVAAHMRGHDEIGADVCIGPMGIESQGRDIGALHEAFAKSPGAAQKDMRLQFGENVQAFVNTVTRNFSITRSFLEKLAQPLFDEQFSYSLEPQSGFGWEDIEMGYRLHQRGARIWFCANAVSVHKTHPPEVADSEKAIRSATNFAKLFDKHPQILLLAPDWAGQTYDRIVAWLDRHDHDAVALRARLAEQFAVAARRTRRRTPQPKRGERRILTYRWHVGHQYDLWKLPYQFDMLKGVTPFTSNWDYKSRPLPANARFVEAADFSPQKKARSFDDYDLAILHFDEYALHPEIQPALTKDWGDAFKWLLRFPGPKIAICHGTPLTRFDLAPPAETADLAGAAAAEEAMREQLERWRQELVDATKGCLVVCNSLEAQRRWGFVSSTTIWHGFDPLNYPPLVPSDAIITVGALSDRPDYRGQRFYEQSIGPLPLGSAHILGDRKLDTVRKRPVPSLPSPAEVGLAHYQTYVHLLHGYGIFFNPTKRSPMPRVRGEAMMLGMAVVTTSPHDGNLIVDDGYSGFVCDVPEHATEVMRQLRAERKLRCAVGRRGREAAIELFHANNYVGEWETVIDQVLGGTVESAATDPAAEVSISTSLLGQRHEGVPLAGRRTGRVRRELAKGVLFVAGTDGGARTWRVDHPVAALAEAGILARSVTLRNFLRDGGELLASGAFNVLVLHRVTDSPSLKALLETAGRKGLHRIADFDDAVFDPSFPHALSEEGRATVAAADAQRTSYRRVIDLVDSATCTTSFLAQALEACDVRRVSLVENCLSRELIDISTAVREGERNQQRAHETVLGYASGSATHALDLETIAEPLLELLTRHSHLRLGLAGLIDIPEALAPVASRISKARLVPHWQLPAVLRRFDINLAPLQSSTFNEAKSAIKYIDAGIVGVPTVASPTASFKKAIDDGRTGFIADDEDGWIEKLERLALDDTLRSEIGEAAVGDCQEKYTPAAWLSQFARHLETCL